jgi:hypothetical protein
MWTHVTTGAVGEGIIRERASNGQTGPAGAHGAGATKSANGFWRMADDATGFRYAPAENQDRPEYRDQPGRGKKNRCSGLSASNCS